MRHDAILVWPPVNIRSRSVVNLRPGVKQCAPLSRPAIETDQSAAKKKRGRGQVRVHGPSSRSVASTRRGGAGSIEIYITAAPSQIPAEPKNGKTPAAGMKLRGLSGASDETLGAFIIGNPIDTDDYNPERFAWLA